MFNEAPVATGFVWAAITAMIKHAMANARSISRAWARGTAAGDPGNARAAHTMLENARNGAAMTALISFPNNGQKIVHSRDSAIGLFSIMVSSRRDHPSDHAIEPLYERYRRPLLAFFKRSSPHEDAEDLTQDVFVRLARHTDPTAIARPSAYIFQIASNLLRDARRQSRARAASGHVNLDTVAAEQHLPQALIEEIHPERVLLGKRTAADFAAALSALPERTRDIFLLYRLDRMRQKDIATTLGVSVSSVEKHLTKAIALLTKAMAHDD